MSSSYKRRLRVSTSPREPPPPPHASGGARCRNPFCGAPLANPRLRYCETSRLCQLRRGLALSCAWPNAPPSPPPEPRDGDDPAGPPGLSPDARSTPTPGAVGDAGRGEKRVMIDNVVNTLITKKKARVLQRQPSADSVLSVALSTPGSTPTRPPTPPTTLPIDPSPRAAQQLKASAGALSEAVPLGVGARLGGGGRYVRSGNRSSLQKSTSLPVMISSAPAANGQSTASAPSSVVAPPRAPSPAPPSRPPSPADSVRATPAGTTRRPPAPTVDATLPPTTTNRNRDPRVRTNATAAPSMDTADNAPSVRRISAADYLSKLKATNDSDTPVPAPQRVPPPTASSSSSSSLRDRAPSPSGSSTSSSSTTRQLARTLSSTSMPPPAPPTRPSPTHASSYGESKSALRRSQSDITNWQSTDYVADPRYPRDGPSSSSSSWNRHASDGFSRPPSRDSDHRAPAHSAGNWSARPPPFHGDRDAPHHHPYPPSNFQRSSTDREHPASAREDHRDDRRDDRHSVGLSSSGHDRHSTAQVPRTPHYPAVLTSRFSHNDPFLPLVLSRMASFMPGSLAAIRNQTKNPRKLRFYLDYAQRVHDFCGRLVKLTVQNGTARITIADREWLALKGTSTVDLYQSILEEFLFCCEAWQELIVEMREYHTNARQRYEVAIPGVSFIKVWQGLKGGYPSKASRLERQLSRVSGSRNHWIFTVGLVDIGTGSGEDVKAAFKHAANAAFAFLMRLTIYDEREKKHVAAIDRGQRQHVTRDGSGPPASMSTQPTAQRAGAAQSGNRTRAPNEGLPAARTADSSARRVELTTQTIPLETNTPTARDRQRSDSWNDSAELNAAFSPADKSESNESAESGELMDISDEDRPKQPQTTPPAANSTPKVPSQPPILPSCRFCAEMQSHKPGAKCLRCVRNHGDQGSAQGASNRNVEALHAFLRQPVDSSAPNRTVVLAPTPDTAQDTLERLQNGLSSHR